MEKTKAQPQGHGKPDAEKTSNKAPTYEEVCNKVFYFANRYTKETRERKFVITDQNRCVFEALVQWFFDFPEQFRQNNCIRNEKSMNKGILLAGNTGSGKTLLMEIFSRLRLRYNRFEIKSTREMNRLFNAKGHEGIARFSHNAIKIRGTQIMSRKIVCFDDLGNEEHETVHFNNRISVMEHILDERYRLWVQFNLATHLTTNLTMGDIEEIYGPRIYSRVHEMFNIIYLGSSEDSKDMRLWSQSNK